MDGAVAFKCKYCQKYYTNKHEFAQHKRDEHQDQMSSTSDMSRRSANGHSSTSSGAKRLTRSDRLRAAPAGGSSPQFAAPPAPNSKRRRPRSSSIEVEMEASQSEESSPASPPSPAAVTARPAPGPAAGPAAGAAARPGPKSKTKLPLPIGKKKKVVRNGVEEEEWIRNPKFNGA